MAVYICIAPIAEKSCTSQSNVGSHLRLCCCCPCLGHVTCHNTVLSPPNSMQHFFDFFKIPMLKMCFVFGVKGALFVSLVSRPHVLSPVQSLYPGLDICSVSCLIVAVVLTEEQTKNGFDVLMNTSAVTLCKHSFWTYQFQSRLL